MEVFVLAGIGDQHFEDLPGYNSLQPNNLGSLSIKRKSTIKSEINNTGEVRRRSSAIRTLIEPALNILSSQPGRLSMSQEAIQLDQHYSSNVLGMDKGVTEALTANTAEHSKRPSMIASLLTRYGSKRSQISPLPLSHSKQEQHSHHSMAIINTAPIIMKSSANQLQSAMIGAIP
ncbi:hypothetical protein HDU76_011181, partial [Blyttiomyces sp. JEL0837]